MKMTKSMKMSSIGGLGCDIVEISRIIESIEKHKNHFLDRIFTPKEQDYCKSHPERFAGRFAAKEALAKALGCGFGKDLSFLDIEITNDIKGKPHITLKSRVRDLYPYSAIHLSISHSKENAMAVVILEREGE